MSDVAQASLACPKAGDDGHPFGQVVLVLQGGGALVACTPWLACDRFSLAEVGVIPYVNRLDMLQLSGLWTETRPHLADWWRRVKARPSFEPAMLKYVPSALVELMRTHGSEAWPTVRAVVTNQA
jgi:hypothetical protein